MTPKSWQQGWQRGEIGFHSDEINPHLAEHWPRLQVPPGSRVFVPLCGKTLDLLWLANAGYRVLGNELSPIAIDEFLADYRLDATRTAVPPFERVCVDDIEFLIGDFFDLTPAHLADIGAVYDRASLIALTRTERPRYAEALIELLPARVSSLLVTLDYDQAEMNGPPFAVSRDDVERLFGAAFSIEPIASYDVLAEHPRFQASGLTALAEQVYLMQRR